MGSATTFATMIDNPSSEKIFLAEMKLAEELSDWTLTVAQTYTYEIVYLNEIITLADSLMEIIRKEVSSIEEDGTALTRLYSIADVEVNAGSFFHDLSAGILYVHPSGDDSPAGYTLIAYFWLYFATKGVILGRVETEWEEGVEWEDGIEWGAGYQGQYYEPYIADRGIPQISQQISDIHWGISNISSGSLVLLNGRGYFDQISRKFLWTNKTIKILLGGDLLPYSEYSTIFTGKIIDKTFTSSELTLELRSNSFDLLRQLPINHFWTTNYARLDPSAEGRSIPYYYGVYDITQAPVVTCIDTDYTGADTYQFKLCDHAINSITQVYIDYGDGMGWQAIGHANEDLALATFTVVSATFVVGTSRIKVAFEGKASGGVAISGAPEIAEDILLNFCGYAAAILNTASFTASKAVSECVLNVPIEMETSTLSIIEKICQSDLAIFDEDGDGKLRYRTWGPTATGDLPVLDSTDILGQPEITDDIDRLFRKIKIGYSYQCSLENYLYKEDSDNSSLYKYGKNETLIMDTYLRNSVDAVTLAGRILWVSKNISPLLRVDLKISQISKTLGDKVNVTLARAPYATSGGYSERTFEIFEKNLTCFPVQLSLGLRDLMDFGVDVGFWMADTAPAWAAATAQERDNSGFWCDANGYCLTADLSSLNKSLWW